MITAGLVQPDSVSLARIRMKVVLSQNLTALSHSHFDCCHCLFVEYSQCTTTMNVT